MILSHVNEFVPGRQFLNYSPIEVLYDIIVV